MCQVRTACAALVQSKSLSARLTQELLERTARLIRRIQRRNAAARHCHCRTALRRLLAKQIHLDRLPRCRWEPDS